MLGLVLMCIGQAGAASLRSHLRFEHLTTDDGLSTPVMTDIIQDSRGYMWFGTKRGLNRYDGYRTTVFSHDAADPLSIADNWVLSLHEDAQQRLWVGTRAGLQRYDPLHEKFIDAAAPGETAAVRGKRDVRVSAISGDGKDGLWLGTFTDVQHYEPATQRFLTMPAAAGRDGPAVKVVALARDRAGNLWIGTERGLDKLAPGAARPEHFSLDSAAQPNPVHNTILSLRVDQGDTLWVGTQQGLEAWPLGAPGQGGGAGLERHRFGKAEGMSETAIITIVEARDGSLWFGTQEGVFHLRTAPGAGLREMAAPGHRIDVDQHRVGDPNSYASDWVKKIYQDRGGVLWFASYDQGVDRVDLGSGEFKHYLYTPDAPGSLSSERVNKISGDGHGTIWLAGDSHGFGRLDVASADIELVKGDPRHPKQNISAVLWDPAGYVWLGTRDGLRRYDPRSGTYTDFNGPNDDVEGKSVSTLYQDRHGVLWLGTVSKGLARFDPATGQSRYFTHDGADARSLSNDTVYALAEDRFGALWVGTTDGLNRMEADGHFTRFTARPGDAHSISNNYVLGMMRDHAQRLWVGTSAGLNRVDQEADGRVAFTPIANENGETGKDLVAAIVEDGHGNLWYSGRGITRLDPLSGALRRYTPRDGVQGGAFYGGSAYRDTDGTMYFGGTNGLTSFHPDAIGKNAQAPGLAITDILIENRSIADRKFPPGVSFAGAVGATGALTLGPRQSQFTLEFAALHYADAQRNHYAWRLDGFDQNWVMGDARRRVATYTNLDPGNYVFRVRAANKDGVWNEEGIALAITLTPPFWKTWWFRALLLAAALLGTWGAYRMRMRVLIGQRTMLERQVGERTAELLQQKQIVEQQKAIVESEKENVEMAHRNISMLSEIGRQITQMLDAEAIMNMVYARVQGLMDATQFGIGIYRPEQNVIDFSFAMERGQPIAPYSRSMLDPNQFSVWCLQHRAEVFINELELDYARYLEPAGLATVTFGQRGDGADLEAARSMLYAPMLIKGKALGVITVQSPRPQAYARMDMDMLVTLASYTAVALDNANAYQQLGQALSALQESEQQLRFQDKMASIGTLTAGIAHEINNPANFALVGAQLLAGELVKFRAMLLQLAGDDADADVKAILNGGVDGLAVQVATIVEGTSRIRALVNDLRTFSRLGEAHRKAVPIADNITSTVNLVRAQYADMMTIECALDANPELECWPAQLNQVFMNLIVNACHAIEQQQRSGTQARAGLLRISSRVEGDTLVLAFEDNGCGIAPDKISRIFEPFFTTKDVGDGTGLGLSISFGIIEKHHGKIEVVSVLGEGSCFTLRLPMHWAEQDQQGALA